jgi:hypothetical protein
MRPLLLPEQETVTADTASIESTETQAKDRIPVRYRTARPDASVVPGDLVRWMELQLFWSAQAMMFRANCRRNGGASSPRSGLILGYALILHMPSWVTSTAPAPKRRSSISGIRAWFISNVQRGPKVSQPM